MAALTAVEGGVGAIVAARAVVAATVAVVAAEAPLLTATVNLFVNSTARPDFPNGPFVFHDHLQMKFS